MGTQELTGQWLTFPIIIWIIIIWTAKIWTLKIWTVIIWYSHRCGNIWFFKGIRFSSPSKTTGKAAVIWNKWPCSIMYHLILGKPLSTSNSQRQLIIMVTGYLWCPSRYCPWTSSLLNIHQWHRWKLILRDTPLCWWLHLIQSNKITCRYRNNAKGHRYPPFLVPPVANKL